MKVPSQGEGGSTLGDLEALAGAGLTGLLAFLLPGITGEELVFAEGVLKIGIRLEEGAGDTELDGTDLTGHSTTHGADGSVVLVGDIGGLEGVEHLVLEGESTEVILEGALVDRDLTRARDKGDAGGGGLATSRGGVGFAHVR